MKETSDAEQKEAFYEQDNAVQKGLPKGNNVIRMGQTDAKVGSDNTLLGHVMGSWGP